MNKDTKLKNKEKFINDILSKFQEDKEKKYYIIYPNNKKEDLKCDCANDKFYYFYNGLICSECFTRYCISHSCYLSEKE